MCTCVIQRILNQQFGSHVDKPTYSDHDQCFSQVDFEDSAFNVLSSEDEVYISTLCTFLHPGFT